MINVKLTRLVLTLICFFSLASTSLAFPDVTKMTQTELLSRSIQSLEIASEYLQELKVRPHSDSRLDYQAILNSLQQLQLQLKLTHKMQILN